MGSDHDDCGCNGVFRVGFGRRIGSKGTVSDPHSVLGGVPELLRLADGRFDAQLQEIRTTRSDYPVIELYG